MVASSWNNALKNIDVSSLNFKAAHKLLDIFTGGFPHAAEKIRKEDRFPCIGATWNKTQKHTGIYIGIFGLFC